MQTRRRDRMEGSAGEGVNYKSTPTVNGSKLNIVISEGKIQTGSSAINAVLNGNIKAYKDGKGKWYYTSILDGKRLFDYNGLTPAKFITKLIEINDIKFGIKQKTQKIIEE